MIITPGVEIGLLFCFQNSFYAYYFSFVSWESITWAVVMGIRGDGVGGKGNGGEWLRLRDYCINMSGKKEGEEKGIE